MVAVGEETEGEEAEAVPAQLAEVAAQLRSAVRTSDILARIGPREFAVVAPDTPPDGAQILATRLSEMSVAAGSSQAFRAGVYSVDDLQRANLDPMEFLLRATRATDESRNN